MPEIVFQYESRGVIHRDEVKRLYCDSFHLHMAIYLGVTWKYNGLDYIMHFLRLKSLYIDCPVETCLYHCTVQY